MVHFQGSTISIWSHWPFGPVTVKIYWPRFKEYWPGQKSKEANSNFDGCVSMGILPYWIWISMCMSNVVLASWFPVGACLYCNMWSYYFRTLNGFSFGKYFFQTYFPWQKRFNKQDFAEICHELLCTISFLVVSCHKWLTMMGIRCKLCQKKKKKAKTKLVFLFVIFQPLPHLSSGGHKWQAYVFFSDSSFSYCFLVAFRLFCSGLIVWLGFCLGYRGLEASLCVIISDPLKAVKLY